MQIEQFKGRAGYSPSFADQEVLEMPPPPPPRYIAISRDIVRLEFNATKSDLRESPTSRGRVWRD